MPPVQIKICGLTDAAAVDAACRAGADHAGFVFFPPSPRHLDFDRAGALGARVPRSVNKVGVFVDPDDALIERAVRAAALDAIQLHGSETPARVAAVGARTLLPVWKAIGIKTRADLDAAAAYAGAASLVLLDARTPPGAALPGGMGLRFDWTILRDWSAPLPWGMSGGLDPANVAEALAITGAALVDVSSGVERAPGVKDVDKIAAFCEAARRA
jgi:phosphoribosylanthranilate isomerase